MKVLIELDDDVFKDIRESDFDSARAIVRNFQATFTDAIKNGTPIPDNATNGDMIKAMFPNQTIDCAIPITDRNGAKFYRTTINGVTDFTADWWNEAYKVGAENG